MARHSPIERLAADDRDRLDADILRGDLSWRQLAAKYAIHEATLRKHSERSGLIRNPTGLKRALVEQAIARPDASDKTQDKTHGTQRVEPVSPGRSDIETAAKEDERDMRLILQGARIAATLCASELRRALPQSKDGVPAAVHAAKDIKILSEALAINMNTIRTIRKLDVPFGPDDMRRYSDEQLERIAKGRAP